MKYKCIQCKINEAVWVYSPYTENRSEEERYLCDACIDRGCSCWFDSETGKDILDDAGRLRPCCEYDFNESGYEMDNIQ